MGAIGAISPVLPVLSGVVSTVSGIKDTINEARGLSRNRAGELAVRQAEERGRLSEQQRAEQNALDRARIAQDSAAKEEERKAALRRAVARQRAQFGSQGVGSSGGSADAVLLGIFEESDDARQRREEADALRTRALDLGDAQAKSLNLLQATQLSARSRLDDVW